MSKPKAKTSVSKMTSEEVLTTLGVSDMRTLLNNKDFPKPLFEGDKIMFRKKQLCKYFNVDNMDEPFITLKEAAKFLDLKETRLSNFSLMGRVPNYRVKSIKGSGYLYRKSELEKIKNVRIEGNVEFVNNFAGSEILRSFFLKFITKYEAVFPQKDYDIVCKYLIQGWNLAEIGAKVGLSRERVRQIIEKATKRLTNDKYFHPLEYVELERKLAQKDMEIKYLKATYGIKDDKLDMTDGQTDFVTKFLCQRIEDLDLTVRAYHCLHDAGVVNVYDLAEFCYKDDFRTLSKIRNSGKRTVDEVRDLLKDFNKKLKSETLIDLKDLVNSDFKVRYQIG